MRYTRMYVTGSEYSFNTNYWRNSACVKGLKTITTPTIYTNRTDLLCFFLPERCNRCEIRSISDLVEKRDSSYSESNHDGNLNGAGVVLFSDIHDWLVVDDRTAYMDSYGCDKINKGEVCDFILCSTEQK